MRITTVITLVVIFGINAFADAVVKASPSSSSAPLKIEDWQRVLEGFKEELKALQAIPTQLSAPDFNTTRRLMLSKYIQLYVRVCDAAKRHDNQGPYPASMDVAPPEEKGAHEFLFSGMSPTDIKEPKTRKAYEKTIEQNRINLLHVTFDNDLQKFKLQVVGALGGYCGYAFGFDNDEKNAVIRAHVADVTLRKRLQEDLLLPVEK